MNISPLPPAEGSCASRFGVPDKQWGQPVFSGFPVAAERVKSIGWAASLSHDGLAGSLTIWFEEREAWTARSLRAPFRVSILGDAVNETSAVYVFSENSQFVVRSGSSERDWVTCEPRQCVNTNAG